MNTIMLQGQTLAYVGDASMLLCPMTVYLSSHREPEGVNALVYQWVSGLDAASCCVMVGNLTSGERYALRLLIERGVPVVLALASAIPADLRELRLDAAAVAAFNVGRLVIVSPVTDPTVSDHTGKTSAARNRLMIDLAECIVVGFMAENGNLQRQLLGRHNVTVLKADGQEQVRETDADRLKYNATQMGWSIYKRLRESSLGAMAADGDATHGPVITSLEARQLLAQYIQLEAIERPSLLHSLLLSVVVRRYAMLPDFDFSAFLRLWGVQYLRPEDLRATKVDGHWMPSLADRVLARLFKALPNKFRAVVNPNERFDTQIVHQILDPMLARNARKPNQRLLQRALNLAYFEHDSAAIARYRQMLGKES